MSLPRIDPTQYEHQLSEKQAFIERRFAEFEPPGLEVFASPATYYRMRAEFRVWHEGEDLFFAMYDADPDRPGEKKIVRMDQYPAASKRINELMLSLREALMASNTLRHRLFQVEFLTTLSGEALVTLIYHRKVDEVWAEAARALEARLDVAIIGRARKQRWVLTRDFVTEHLQVDGHTFHYQQVENSFTQPNARICADMLAWARAATTPAARGIDSVEAGGDLVELYCGNGNFTIALASNFRRVLGTEISRTSVASAQVNLAANHVDNAVIARMSSEEFSQALAGEKTGRRVSDMALDGYDFSTVLVDPPRAGLDEKSCEEVARYTRIVYISCNPDTLAENLTQLCRTHTIERMALFDQFPYTHHCECGVVLVGR